MPSLLGQSFRAVAHSPYSPRIWSKDSLLCCFSTATAKLWGTYRFQEVQTFCKTPRAKSFDIRGVSLMQSSKYYSVIDSWNRLRDAIAAKAGELSTPFNRKKAHEIEVIGVKSLPADRVLMWKVASDSTLPREFLLLSRLSWRQICQPSSLSFSRKSYLSRRHLVITAASRICLCLQRRKRTRVASWISCPPQCLLVKTQSLKKQLHQGRERSTQIKIDQEIRRDDDTGQ